MKKIIHIYANNAHKAFARIESEGGEMMKHQIANAILINLDSQENLKKIRINIEEEE